MLLLLLLIVCRAGYSELEIELFFKKYDITDSKITAMDEDRLSFRQGKVMFMEG